MKKLFLALIYWSCSCNSLQFASYYQDRMVLQREPLSATIWGVGEILPGMEVALYCEESGHQLFKRLQYHQVVTREEYGRQPFHSKLVGLSVIFRY